MGTVAEYEEVLTKASGRQFHLRALDRAQLKASPLLLGAQQAFVHTASYMTFVTILVCSIQQSMQHRKDMMSLSVQHSTPSAFTSQHVKLTCPLTTKAGMPRTGLSRHAKVWQVRAASC